MSADFVAFPTTPHLLWLGTSPLRSDKLLPRVAAESFLQQPVVIEEKIDGANVGISFDVRGELVAQNRGSVLRPEAHDQFKPLWPWLRQIELPLFDVLDQSLILFGEWCFARHSISYTRLPGWFLAFDVYDRRERRFFSTVRRNEIAARLDLPTVPQVGAGRVQLAEIPHWIGQSAFYDGPMEGVYLRQEDESWLHQRAKVVRPEFARQIDEHWSRQPLVPNRLAATTAVGPPRTATDSRG